MRYIRLSDNESNNLLTNIFMRKQLFVLALMASLTASAETYVEQARPWSNFCDSAMKILELPYYYCSCKEFSNAFTFPLETEITDTVWYTASLNDLKRGVSAYWFSNTSVTMEIYAFCSSIGPTFSFTVGPNQMKDMDSQKINAKLAELNEQQKAMAETLTPHMRVYPHNGGTGKVYCYPYDQGPESTCEDPLPLRPGMTYICEKEENVYRMEWSSIASTGKAFVLWKQVKNRPCEVWLTLDSCTGEEVGRAALSDSLHVYQPDSATLVSARNAKRSLWLHVKHDKGYVGRVYCYNNPKYTEEVKAPLDSKTCAGKTLSANFRTYSTDTAFVDTLWVTRDTLTTQEIAFAFTQPKMEYDTLYLSQVDLARGYRYPSSSVVFYACTDSVVWIKKQGACDRVIQVTVLPKIGEEVEYVGSADKRSCKYIQNGKLFILVDDRKYNVLGQQIKTNK